MMWDVYEPEEGRWYCWHLGGARAHLKKTIRADGEQISAARRYCVDFSAIVYVDAVGDAVANAVAMMPGTDSELAGPFFEEPADTQLEKLVWADTERVELGIDFPAEPCVVTPEESLVLGAGTEALFYTALPPVVSFAYPAGDIFYVDSPFRVSKCWWGKNTTAGQLCYSLPRSLISAAEARSRRKAANPLLVQCPVLFKNTSRSLQTVTRVFLETEELSVYDAAGFLYTDVIEIEITANEWKITVCRPRDVAPVDAWCRAGAEEREVSVGIKAGAGKIIRRKSADFLKSITKF